MLLHSRSRYLWPSVYGTNNSSIAVSKSAVIVLTFIGVTAADPVIVRRNSVASKGVRGDTCGNSYTFKSSTNVDI